MTDLSARREAELEVLILVTVHYEHTGTPLPFSTLTTYVFDLLPVRDLDRTSVLAIVIEGHPGRLTRMVADLARRGLITMGPNGVMPASSAYRLLKELEPGRPVIEDHARHIVDRFAHLAARFGVHP